MDSNSEHTGKVSANALLAAVGELIERPLYPLSDDEAVETLRGVERAARMLAGVQQRLLMEIDTRGVPKRVGSRTIKRFLMETLRLSNAEAGSRVHQAQWLGSFTRPSGFESDPVLATTAGSLERGDISREHVRAIITVMKRVPHGIGSAEQQAAEAILTDFAVTGSPDDVPKIGSAMLAYLDPDGKLTDDADRARMRGIRIGAQRTDGMSPISGEITPTLRAVLDPILAKYARPGVANPKDPASPGAGVDRVDPKVLAEAAGRDTRTAAQRTHDAIELMASELIDPAKLGSHRGMPVSTVLTMSIDALEHASGVATTATGGTVPITEALRMAEKSRPYLEVFDRNGLPLHLGQG